MDTIMIYVYVERMDNSPSRREVEPSMYQGWKKPDFSGEKIGFLGFNIKTVGMWRARDLHHVHRG